MKRTLTLTLVLAAIALAAVAADRRITQLPATTSPSTAAVLEVEDTNTAPSSRSMTLKQVSANWVASGTTNSTLAGTATATNGFRAGDGIPSDSFPVFYDVAGSVSTQAYAFRSLMSVGGASSYADFNSRLQTSGADNRDHIVSFQSMPRHYGTGTLSKMYGLYFVGTDNAGSGQITNVYGSYIADFTGLVKPISIYGHYIESLTQGASNNYGVFINTPSGGAVKNVGLYNHGTSELFNNVSISDSGTATHSGALLDLTIDDNNVWGWRLLNTTYSSDRAFSFQVLQANDGTALIYSKGGNVVSMTRTNVGINTNAPTQALEVLGNIKASGSFIVAGTTNQVIFGATNSAPVSSAAPTKWISVQVSGESTVYRLPLYE